MSYTTGIPTAAQSLNQTQQKIQDNFTVLNNTISENHIAMNVVGAGNHKYLVMPVQNFNTDIIPKTAASTGVLFTRTENQTQLEYTSDVANNRYILTRCINASFGTFGNYTPYGSPPAGFTQSGGWTFLPGRGGDGGMLMQYGFYGKSGATGSSGTIQFPVAFTFFPYSIQITLYRSSGDQSLTVDSGTVPGTTSFAFRTSSSGSDGIYWSAIGV